MRQNGWVEKSYPHRPYADGGTNENTCRVNPMFTTLTSIANPMPKKENPHWPVQHPRPVRAKGSAGYVHLKHTLTAAQLSTREIETTTLRLPTCSGDLVEAVAEKYDV